MRSLAALAACAALALAAPATGSRTGFSAHIDNPWFPLRPGTTLVYTGKKDGEPARDVFRVTHATATIAGAPCVVVDDRLYLSGKLRERTTDWYSQDAKGNVWYFGERTAELDRRGRVVSTAGTWQAGTDGARPGVFMPAHPRVGQTLVQEHAKGVAQDRFRIVAVGATRLETREWTPLEPGVLDRKVYIRDVGTEVEQTIKGGDEYLKLAAVRHG
ncbi:MAG: hypothetical protein ACXWYS_02790 [Gaiellaceae bacterium]